MAASKSAQKVAEEPKAKESQIEEPKVEEPKTEEPKVEAEEPKASSKMVKVRNKARFDYVQPSTGIKIYVNTSEPTEVKDDGWVKHFVGAGLLEYV